MTPTRVDPAVAKMQEPYAGMAFDYTVDRIEPMQLGDLPDIHAIERASFNAPWPANAYRSELESNRLAHRLEPYTNLLLTMLGDAA